MSNRWSRVAMGVIALVLLLSACAKPTPDRFREFRERRPPRPDTGAPAATPTPAPPTAAPRLQFVVDEPLPEARLGEPYLGGQGYSFCQPRPVSDLLCGGLIPDPRISRPIGGVQPYTFQRDTLSEFLPTGLTLHPNGVLDGIPDPQRARAGTYNLTICAVDNLRSSRCSKVELLVRPAAATPTPTPRPTLTPTLKPTPTPTLTPVPQPQVLTYRGTFTMTATTGDYHYVGNGDEKVNATISFTFDMTLQRPASGGRLLRGEATVRPPWSGEWAKRSSASGCSERSGSVKGTGGEGVKIGGELDPDKPEQVKISVDFLSVNKLAENLEGFPRECPYWLSSATNLLFASFWDCADKKSCTIFKASGDSLSFGAAGAQIGVAQREYLYSSGRYNGTAQLTLVSQTRR